MIAPLGDLPEFSTRERGMTKVLADTPLHRYDEQTIVCLSTATGAWEPCRGSRNRRPHYDLESLALGGFRHRWTVAWTQWGNGVIAFYLICTQCHRRDNRALPHDAVRARFATAEISMATIPELIQPDGEVWLAGYFYDCERCGANTSELHHWAPSSIFEDSWGWPTSYLCKECHGTWHAVMRENGLRLRVAA